MEHHSTDIRLTSIAIYPVKSLACYQSDTATVEKQGLKGDRMHMLVDANGMFISQRKFPQLALLKAQQQNGNLVISTKQNKPLKIAASDFTTSNKIFQVWQDKVCAKQAKTEINQFFSDFLNQQVTLIQYDKQQARASDPKYSKTNDIVSFADGFPLLLINRASLDQLNQRLDKPVSLQNFRGNLVIEGVEAFAEDHWKQIRIGNIEFDLVKPCSRCVMTCVDPQTGIASTSTQPLKTLAQFRNTKQGIMFGINLIPRSHGKIVVGDKLEVTRFIK